MIFRPIRELLEESMNDRKEITTFQELYDLINRKEIKSYAELPLKISFIFDGFYSRINTNVWTVCIKHLKYDYPQAIGYLHDNPEKLLR